MTTEFFPVTPILRIGLANVNGAMPAVMESRDLPVLVSANALFDHTRGEFRAVPMHLQNLDVALDSAGFVAMARYRRYPWTVAQYVDLAFLNGFTWWSAMDCCCEPEIAGDRQTVRARVHATVDLLTRCRDRYSAILGAAPEFAAFSTPPVPIVQGWTADDYRESVHLTDAALGGNWPAMVGVGSVCRRELGGPDGLWRILTALDGALPAGVGLHLFGVKGTALRGLADHPRVVSMDSMAFEFRARRAARDLGVSKTVAFRAQTLDGWIHRQTDHLATPQLRLAL